jgi:phosphoglycolate phosphatase-like HAD superfamily hydrolase
MLETMVSAILGREHSLDAAGEGGSGLTGSGGAGVGQTDSGTAGEGAAGVGQNGSGTAGRRKAVDSGTYRRVEEACRSFIESTTGVQTLVQMEGLRGLVERFGVAETVRSAAEYKAMYNAALMRFVNGRLDALEDGRLSNAELTICGAIEFLRHLAGLGVRLYLASGTDVGDVRREAAALGYAELFGDRIYGATGDIQSEPKRLALRAILQDIAARGKGKAADEGVGAGRTSAAGTDAGEIVTFGDGPVEMRETRKRGGFCVGIASDEVRRFGWNEAKRSRLVLAGAHILIPDFGCRDELSAYLFNG